MHAVITHKGDFSKIEIFLNKLKGKRYLNIVDRYAKLGVEALRAATPVDTGLTSRSWAYRIEESGDTITVVFTNSNVNKNVNIAMILQYGHGTGTGGWVEGVDYINPALKPIFEQFAQDCWREVKS